MLLRSGGTSGERVGALEGRVGSLESQVSQLRVEMRDGFIAVTTELGTQIETSWQRTLVLHEELVGQIRTIGERWNGRPAATSRSPRRKR